MRWLPLLLLAGCAYAEPPRDAPITESVSYTIHGDTACPNYVRSDAESSARDWGTVSEGHIAFRYVWDLSPMTLFALQDEPLFVCRSASWSDGRYCGMTTGTIVEVALSPRCNTRATALHELGHLAGITKHTAHGSVMHEYDDVRHLTRVDVEACAAIGLCRHPGRQPDVTTVTVTVDPAIPQVEPDYPEWSHQ